MAKKVVALALAALLAIGSVFAFPYAKTAYKRCKARSLINATASEFAKFGATLDRSKEIVDTNFYLLVDEEKEKPYAEISDSNKKKLEIGGNISKNKLAFERKEYDDVRRNLDSRFGLKKGKRETLIDIMQNEEQELKSVMDFCESKKNMRNKVWANELYLIARLKSPYNTEEEKVERLALLPEQLLKQVPVWSQELDEKLKKLDPGLHNNLGVCLLNHQDILEHIIKYGREERVNDNALKIYYSAENAYKQAMPLNDELLWYRPQKHDGKMPAISYQELLEKQRRVILLMKEGDNHLQKLQNYYNELHEQYYIYVSAHDKQSIEFSHTRLRHVTRYDYEGEPYSDLETYTYYTDGWKFYYETTKVTPSSKTTDRVYVGEEDCSSCSWSYNVDEQVGFVRAWKRLHDDNSAIIKGRIEALNPVIEEE